MSDNRDIIISMEHPELISGNLYCCYRLAYNDGPFYAMYVNRCKSFNPIFLIGFQTYIIYGSEHYMFEELKQ